MKMSERIDWDMVFIVGAETYLDHSVVQTATLNISAAYGQENIIREVY